MRKITSWLLGIWRTCWEKRQLHILQSIKLNKDLLVVDIDNTLTVSKLNEPVNHSNPCPRNSMIKYVQDAIDNKKKVIYLSARDFRLYDETISWLKQYNLYVDGEQSLFLVKSSLDKIPYLQLCIDLNENVTFIDDLSYNYENGEIKIYEESKKRIMRMKLKLLSIDFINSL